MNVGVLGIDFHSSDLSDRERAVRSHYFGLQGIHPLHQKIILSTCNRFEIYFHSGFLPDQERCLSFFQEQLGKDFPVTGYCHFGRDCFSHLCRVTAGLNSAVFGETEIQGQVKRAYAEAIRNRDCSKELHFLFQKSLKIAKSIRTGFLNFKKPTLAEKILGLINSRRDDPNILLIGASYINQSIFRVLRMKYARISLISRTEKNAFARFPSPAVKILPFERLSASLRDYEVIIIATSSPDYVLTKEHVVQRGGLLIDLAVPRNANPNLSEYTELYHLEDLQKDLRGGEISSSAEDFLERAVSEQIASFVRRKLFYAAV